jgi:transposase
MRAALQDRLIGRRRWLYRNIAAFLTKRYSTIALEDEFTAKTMIEDRVSKDEDLPFRRSIKHYQWSAVAELRSYILEAAAKNGARIVGVKTKWSTTTCSICDQYTPHQPRLKLTCPNGHSWDQDVNAASNILRWLKDSGNATPQADGGELKIPDSLKTIAVPMLNANA